MLELDRDKSIRQHYIIKSLIRTKLISKSNLKHILDLTNNPVLLELGWRQGLIDDSRFSYVKFKYKNFKDIYYWSPITKQWEYVDLVRELNVCP